MSLGAASAHSDERSHLHASAGQSVTSKPAASGSIRVALIGLARCRSLTSCSAKSLALLRVGGAEDERETFALVLGSNFSFGAPVMFGASRRNMKFVEY